MKYASVALVAILLTGCTSQPQAKMEGERIIVDPNEAVQIAKNTSSYAALREVAGSEDNINVSAHELNTTDFKMFRDGEYGRLHPSEARALLYTNITKTPSFLVVAALRQFQGYIYQVSPQGEILTEVNVAELEDSIRSRQPEQAKMQGFPG